MGRTEQPVGFVIHFGLAKLTADSAVAVHCEAADWTPFDLALTVLDGDTMPATVRDLVALAARKTLGMEAKAAKTARRDFIGSRGENLSMAAARRDGHTSSTHKPLRLGAEFSPEDTTVPGCAKKGSRARKMGREVGSLS